MAGYLVLHKPLFLPVIMRGREKGNVCTALGPNQSERPNPIRSSLDQRGGGGGFMGPTARSASNATDPARAQPMADIAG